ncbi:hypothetical protein [Sphingomonas nostoxanthinifaciens]|uniref:hypothetical protein n=1 Tax=Sphingomonas nostoxanthinifaciens TaxID=2872652 RepID=UPI001CC2034D|nr:hypothetical protein [Sphingomonas nostoxanthinifaciens]UAK25833.1 hypothetical protein K8P63_06820 [Sphingomonas nostoxanthinifaciens]
MASNYHTDVRLLRSPADWLIAGVLACIIAVLALGAHDVAISHLGIIYPDESGVPNWAKYLGQIVRLATMVYVSHLARWRLDQMSPVKAAIALGLLVVFLQETVRIIVVDNIVSDGWIDRRWIYLLMTRLPNAMLSFCSGAAAVTISRTLRHRPIWAVIIVVPIVAAIGLFALLPALKGVAGWIDATLHLAEPPEVYQPPYGFYVYKYIYGTFVEPTIACFVLAYLAWPGLNGTPLRRTAAFVALILLMRGRVVATALFSVWIKAPLPMAIAAEGQFFVETLVMATLTAAVWAHLSRPAR